MIAESDITFVVQGSQYVSGGINKTTLVIDSIRRFYPESQVIFSTSDVAVEASIKADQIIQIEDVGPLEVAGQKPNNTNRQIASTKAGLAQVATKWVCKTRSDVVFTRKVDFATLYDTYAFRSDALPIMSYKQVVIAGVNTKRFDARPEYLNHVSDWFYFSEVAALRALFSMPLYRMKVPSSLKPPAAEVYIWEWYASQHPEFENTLKWAQKFLAANAILVDPFELGIKSMKPGYGFPFGVNGYHGMQHADWYDLYTYFNYGEIDRTNLFKFVRALRRGYYWCRHGCIKCALTIRRIFFRYFKE